MLGTKKILIIFFGSILIAVFVTMPLFQEFLEKQQELRVKREELRKEEEYVKNLKRVDQELEPYVSKIEVIDRAVPDDPSVPSLILYIEEASRGHGMSFEELDSFSTNPSNDFLNLQETSVAFSVIGTYNEFKRFLAALEGSSRIINVKSFLISPGQDEESEAFSFDVVIKTHSY